MFERLPNGQLFFRSIVQNDFNVGTGAMAKVATAGTINQLPKNLSKWYGLLDAFIKQNE